MTLERKSALRFVWLIGLVSFFADMTYQGAHGNAGPYLALLGASGTVVGIVAGAGEFVNYGLRLVFGYWTDRTRKYWWSAFPGYAINLVAVPALALARHWPAAAALLIRERTGKGMGGPARDVMLSLKPPEEISALNILSGKVTDISPSGAQADVRLDCNGAHLLARLTAKSVQRLALGPGRPVYAVIKSVSFERS